uniref:protein tilB homolog n=1 Tax=Ciona intestinalis TaxID=7719 RepID=UPI000180D1AC|nr:protein tilB homolog [Ciona intestinalis]XP_026691423.1 protein tilB homolog [Ciona intestinalis]|eukprot:XP_002131587.1 protein tilB homolog [Ciona intestinalis]
MTRITEELVRKRAEHNECEIFSLEELSLHQQDLEKIEHLDRWCRDLKILYLQNNLIGKIENVGKLKKLEYLNLALNNIERIENLQACESLTKLDLTVNFVGELTSVESLRKNIFLEDLYLTGNPCTQFEGYQEFVFATLPQLKRLDGHEIEKSERIKAVQVLESRRKLIVQQQEKYRVEREKQKKEANEQGKANELVINEENLSKEELEQKKDEEFWKEKVDFTPESRTSIQNKLKENKEKTHDSKFKQPKKEKRERRLFNEEGKPMNINEGKVDFSLTETEDDGAFVLDVACYKYMDTSLIEADVQPWYVQVTMKGQLLQLSLLEEVKPDSSTAKRSQITGHLIVTMPKLDPPPVPAHRPNSERSNVTPKKTKKESPKVSSNLPQKLEVDQSKSFASTLASIASDSPSKENIVKNKFIKPKEKIESKNSEHFVDDPNVPPLI